ncbi:ABC transporter ATP-binding protein [Olivibacter sitiensis]|uniref:ABC transporter ATP-binding protein n=1 Tax=Olivibacter sitiensis TaxID=376470 RepID=UPI0003F59FAC|nr:ABC transporter ATP-binding protein [Olivibacter sitiensis]
MKKNNADTIAPASLPGNRGKAIGVEKPKDSLAVLVRLWKYLSRQKLLLSLVLLALVVNTLANLGGSYLLRPIINDYIVPGNLAGLAKMAFLMIGIYLIGAIASIAQSRLTISMAQKTVMQIRKDLFGKMQMLPVRFYDTHQHGDLMSRFTNDIETVSEALNNSVVQLLISSITLMGTLGLMIYISPMLTLVSLIMVPLMLFTASKIIKKSKQFFGANQAALGTANGYVEEMISGQKVVKVFSHEEEAIHHFEKLNGHLGQQSMKAQFYSGLMMPLMFNISTINYALTAIIGAVLAITRGLDIGGLAAFLQYARQFGRPINEISSQFNSLQSALAGAERIFNIMDEEPEPKDSEDAVAIASVSGDVQFEHVDFSYSPDKQILKGISLHAYKGNKIAFVGETGAGKSTVINLLPRFYDIQSGKITIDGISIEKIKRDDLRRNLAIVFQDTHLFTTSVMENIRYGRLDASDEEVVAAAKLAAADSFITMLPQGYDTLLVNDGSNLSQGQKQLINIARAAIADAPILILDEATSSIDTRTEIAIQKGIDQLMKSRTSFVIAHRLSTVRNADEICVIDKGQIVERGRHEQLLAQKGIYYQLHLRQFD